MSVSPPRPQSPPLNALRAFEAAARLGGFSRAAEELCVTPGAISQHIKSLEEWAGSALFERRSQGVRLTKLGTEVASQFSAAFDELGSAVRSLRSSSAQACINIAVLPSVAQLWLSPRLPAIRAALPNHTISITALDNRPNLSREMFDISIFYGHSTGRDNEVVLEQDVIFPICSPEIAQRLKEPNDLFDEAWLYDALWADDWANWVSHLDFDMSNLKSGPTFSLYSIAVEEAKNGAGVLIGHETLVEAQLKSGVLVAPFQQKVSSGKSLILEFAYEEPGSSAVRAIIEMLTK